MISVCIPVYNGQKYIQSCIEGVLNQKGADFEVLVYSDGSTDKTNDILRGICEWLEKNPLNLENHVEYRFIIEDTNAGIGHARNMLINNARGEYLTFLSHDDFYVRNDTLKSLEYTYKKLKEANNQPFFLYSSLDVLNEKFSKTLHINAPSFQYVDDMRTSILAQARRNSMFVNFSNIFGETELFRKHMFRDDLRQSEDLEFLLRTALLNKVLYVYSGFTGATIRDGDNTTSRTRFKIPEINRKFMDEMNFS